MINLVLQFCILASGHLQGDWSLTGWFSFCNLTCVSVITPPSGACWSFNVFIWYQSHILIRCHCNISLLLAASNTENIYKNSRLKWEAERCYWLSFSSSEKAVPVHSGEQSRQQENDIISTFSPALPDHTKWFPICHPSYTPKKHSNTRLSHLSQRAAADIGFLPFSD